MRIRKVSLALLVAMTLATAATPAVASGGSPGRHCAYRLIPTKRRHHVIRATVRLVGCYPTFAMALEQGSGGNIRVPEQVQPQDLTQAMVDRFTVDRRGTALVGTEYKAINQTGGSSNFTAPDTCQGNIWEATNLQGGDNDNFESGDGFGGCDHNKKFSGPWLAGDDLTCTPNCNTYGDLRNEISSLRWRP